MTGMVDPLFLVNPAMLTVIGVKVVVLDTITDKKK